MRARQGCLVAVGMALLILIGVALAPGQPSPSSTIGSSAAVSVVATSSVALPSLATPMFASSSAPTTGVGPSPGGQPTSRPRATPTEAPPVPPFGHVFVVIMENKEASSIIGNPDAPYINGLARQYALATNFVAVAHPSEPNYLALWSGSTHGVTDDAIHDFTSGRTLADQVEASGRSWHVAAENVPPGCFTGATASGGADGPGTYARKHEPAISWTSVSGDPTRCSRITDFGQFDPNRGDLWLVVPNLCHDMHDCSIARGDAFLRSWLPRILTSAAFADGVVFLTWDEGTSSAGGGGKVAMIAISPLAKAGFASAVRHSHYSLLRTIEDAWDLPCLANACTANDLAELFR